MVHMNHDLFHMKYYVLIRNIQNRVQLNKNIFDNAIYQKIFCKLNIKMAMTINIHQE